jgi:hypothetical protein
MSLEFFTGNDGTAVEYNPSALNKRAMPAGWNTGCRLTTTPPHRTRNGHSAV